MTKMKTFRQKAVIMLCVVMALIVLMFAEYGVASVFDIRYDGLAYLDYTARFIQNYPGVIALEIILALVLCWLLSEEIYRTFKK